MEKHENSKRFFIRLLLLLLRQRKSGKFRVKMGNSFVFFWEKTKENYVTIFASKKLSYFPVSHSLSHFHLSLSHSTEKEEKTGT